MPSFLDGIFMVNRVMKSIKIMSFNILTSSLPSKKHHWNDRKQLVLDIIRRHAPDVVGFQEVQQDQLGTLVDALGDYGCYHQEWHSDVLKQELLPIFYLKDRLAVVQSGTFWINKTPDLPRIEDGEVLRACTWVHLAQADEPSQNAIAVYHSHFDNKKQWLRELGAGLVLDRLSSQSQGIPAIFIGDLNTTPESSAYRRLRTRFRDAFLDAPAIRMPDQITCHAFTGATSMVRFRPTIQWIDYILMDATLKCTNATRILDHPKELAGIYPSDHWPILAEFTLC